MNLIQIHPKLASLRYPIIQGNGQMLSHHFSWCKLPYSNQTNQADLERMWQAFQQKSGAYFGIIHHNNYVGEIAIDRFYEDSKTGNVCYWISEEYQRKGLAKEALAHLKKWASFHTELQYLQIRMEGDNKASELVAIGAGATLAKTVPNFRTSVGRIRTVKEYILKL